MPSISDLAARLSAVVAAQQEILTAVTDPEGVTNLVVARTPDVTGGAGALIALVDGDELVCPAACGAAAELAGKRLPTANCLTGEAVGERRLIRSEAAELDSHVDMAAYRAIGIRSIIIAPLLHGETAIGALEALSPRENAFDDLDAYTLQLLAGMASAALMQAREFRERQASEKRYRMLFEQNVAGVFRSTLDGRILDCNDALVQYLGYSSREELLRKPSWDLYHQRSDREQFIAQLQRDHAVTNFRLHLKKKDGAPMTGVVNVSLIPAEGGETHLLGTFVEEG